MLHVVLPPCSPDQVQVVVPVPVLFTVMKMPLLTLMTATMPS